MTPGANQEAKNGTSNPSKVVMTNGTTLYLGEFSQRKRGEGVVGEGKGMFKDLKAGRDLADLEISQLVKMAKAQSKDAAKI